MVQVPVIDDLVDDTYDVIEALDLGVIDLGLAEFLEILEVVVEDGEDVYVKSMMLLNCYVFLGKLIEEDACF